MIPGQFSYWEKKNFFEADVIIIGAGIVGLNAAITVRSLAPKTTVLVLERGFLPSGASTKNAGFACFGSISELIEQEQITGTDGLHQLIEKRWKGLLKLRNLLGDDKICFENLGGYELFKPEQRQLSEDCVSKLSHFNTLITDIVSQKDVYAEANPKISSFGFDHIDVLIENRLEAQIDPGLMMKSLLQKAQSMGITVLSNCEVSTVQAESESININSNQGLFRCKSVLCANNAFIKQLAPHLDVTPGRGQVIVTKHIPNLKLKGTFHYDKGYYYFRNIGNRVLIGGGRNLDFDAECTTEFGSTFLVQDSLNLLLKDIILPKTSFEIEYRWSGIMAFGTQLFPIVEEIAPHIFVAVRCNGMGIAIGSQTGEEAGHLLVQSL